MRPPSPRLAGLLARLGELEARRARWNLRQWPGLKTWRPPAPPRPAERLRKRIVLYLVSLATLGVVPESFGLGASLLCAGGVVIDAWLIYDDGLDRKGRRQLQRWVRRPSNLIMTAYGRRPYRLASLSVYNQKVLAAHGYTGRCTIVGADLGRTLGLHSDWWRQAERDRWSDAWSLGLRGWGVLSPTDPTKWNLSTGRPRLYLQGVSAYGVRAAFGKARRSFEDQPRGQWVRLDSGKKVAYAGRFIDLVPASQALSGVDSDDLDDHLPAWGLRPIRSSFAARPDGRGAATVTRLVRAVHELALRIDDEAARWGGGLDLRFLWSPGATASAVLLAMGVTPPLAKFRLPDSEYAAWTAGLHGGWVAARLCRVAFPGIDLDVRSAYAAVAVLLGWWRYLTASQVRRHDVTEEFREFLASPDLAASMRGNRTWNRWGLTRVVLRLDGQPVPVETPRPGGGSRMEVRPALSERYDCAWPDAVTATLQAGRPVEVLEAVRLVPVGHQPGLHTVGIPGGELDPAGDPAVALVRRRREAQRARERRLVDAIRAIVNSLVYGNVARFDRDDAAGERPGPLCFPPLACTVAAGCRALLAVFIHELEERGYPAAYWDTDGLIAAGGTSGVLDSDAVRSIAALFDPLDPFGDGESFFKVEAEGTVGVFGQKKYVIVNEAGEVVAHTESGIGGFVPPPGFGARRPSDGRYVVTAEIAQAHLARGDGLLPRLSWEDVAPDWPALERHSLSTPTALDEMPDNLGCRPFSRIVEAISTYGDCHPVALDPGGELADLGLLAFFDARTGPPGEISCHPEATGAFVVDSLRARAVEWGHVADRSPSGPVVLDPLLVRTVGKSGTVFVDDSPQLVYAEVDAASVLLEAARRLRGPLVAEVCGLRPRTARALAVGRQPEPATVAVALSALKERFGPDPLPTLLDLAELAADSCCQWPSCAEATSRPGGSWCPTHARRSGLERAGVFGGAR